MWSILEKRAAAVLCLILSSVQVLGAAVYKVGDSAGWTTIGNVDYKLWAATKTFQIGDIIVFEYNPQFHNVMRVTHTEYRACNASFPISTYTTGNDTITIDTHGHHFYMCAVPGHCQSGQKVDINVLRNPNPNPKVAAPSPPGILPSPVPPVTVSSPSTNGAVTPDRMAADFAAIICALFLLNLHMV